MRIGRGIRYGSNAFLVTLFVLAIVAMVNFLGAKHHFRWDLTKGKLYSLSDQTREVLKNLKKDVKVLAFYREGTGEKLRDLLKEYAYRSDKFHYEFVDPDKYPEKAKAYEIRSYGTIVVQCGDKEEKIFEENEKELTNAILKVIREENKAVYFTEGHGEGRIEDTGVEGYSNAKKALQEANYNVKAVVLAQEGKVPEDCAVLVVAGPQKRFLPNEVDMVREYIGQGGDAFFLLDPGTQVGLEDVLSRWGVEVGKDVVVDVSGVGQLFGIGGPGVPIAAQYGKHPITEKLKGIMTFYPLAQSVRFEREGREGVEGTELVKTSSHSWAETDLSVLKGEGKVRKDPGERSGPISLAVAVTIEAEDDTTGEKKARVAVFGDSDFARNRYFPFQGNGDLFVNTVNWLAEEEELISIRPKQLGFNPIHLTRSQARTLFWISVVLLPLAVLIAGVWVYIRRR